MASKPSSPAKKNKKFSKTAPSNESDAKEPTHIVGVGASAGGLEALQSFFKHIPADLNVAFIVVQHLSPDFHSVMDELLAKVTSLPIAHVQDGMKPQANSIYLNSPRTNLLMAEGRLLLADQPDDKQPRMPIDTFFRSLAEDQQERAISIVLSGTGSDGSRGIKLVKEVGGLVIVQDPEDAKFDGMPRSSFNTGIVDIVLPAAEMANNLRSYLNHPLIKKEKIIHNKHYDDDQNALDDIFTLLKEHSDIDFSEYKPSTIARRIERRMSISQLDTFKDYNVLLMSSKNELIKLSEDLLIGVTEFFRDTEAFKILREEALPELIKSTQPSQPIRVWVAGCSSGEEAYSIAISLDMAMKNIGEKRTIKIFATDVDHNAINEAGTGIYEANSLSDVDPAIINEYFTLEGDEFVVSPKIRKMIVFAVHNLIKDPPFSGIHLVTCRNVLIYFQQSVQRRVIAALQFSLVQHGFLFLGSSESLSDAHKSYAVIDERYRIFKKIDNLRLPLPSLAKTREDSTRTASARTPSVGVLMKAHRGQNKDAIYKPVTYKLFERFIPSTIVVDDELNVVHIYGDVDSYTRKHRSGEFSAKVVDILNEDLAIPVSTAIHNAMESQADILYENVVIDKATQPRLINIHGIYVDSETIGNCHVIISFETAHANTTEKNIEIVPFDEETQSKQRIVDLENQLKKNQEHLQVTIEELETTNEELQASNEELMSANEELQSTNEELQSVNEELYTVNNEFQFKIDEITQVNLDLDNLIQSSQIGMIFLDDSLMIRSYTPSAEKYINLLSSDIGRPFHHISHKLNYSQLLEDIAKVIEQQKPRWQETKSKDLVDLLITINPYYAGDNIVHGCVISLTDISEVKNLKHNLIATQMTLQSLFKDNFAVNDEDLITVLIFDDDEGEIELTERYLRSIEDQQYHVLKASNETEALNYLKNDKVQICMIDYNLGKQKATDFIAELPHDIRDQVAFILITNHLNEEIDMKATKQGIFNSIAKTDLSASFLKHIIQATFRAHVAIQKSNGNTERLLN